jgi:hypothetical protein
VRWPDNEVLLNRIARYGLPLLVVIFYVQAVRFLEFTPDHGFIVPTYAAGLVDGVGLEGPLWSSDGGTPSPLWVLLVSAGGALGIDLVLTAKIFGLFFGSLTVLATYLVVFQLLDDRIVSLCVALLVATGPWLMMTSVAGDGVTLALALSLGGLFFHLKGDLLVGVLMAALAGLVLWPALLLGAICVADDLRRADGAAERRRRGTTAGLLLVSILALWGLLAWKLGAGVLPLPTGTMQPLDPVTTVTLALFAGIGLASIFLAASRRRGAIGRQSKLPLLVLWEVAAIVAGIATRSDAVLLAYPLLMVTGFLGVFLGFPPLGSDGRFRLGPVFAVTAVLLLANQAGLHFFTRPAMLEGGVEVAQLESAASWVRASALPGTSVTSDRPWTVSYLTGSAVTPYSESALPGPDIVVLSHGNVPGYVRSYRAPIELGPDGPEVAGEVSVWTKSGE